jgi:hypothetical protein
MKKYLLGLLLVLPLAACDIWVDENEPKEPAPVEEPAPVPEPAPEPEPDEPETPELPE